MKKVILLVITILALFWMFYSPIKVENKAIPLEHWKNDDVKIKASVPVIIQNKKPTVEAGEEQNITFGNEVTLETIAKDKDGEIISYLWREDNQTLSEEESFDYTFEKGVHHLQVIVTDNDGAEAEDNVTVNVGSWVLVEIMNIKTRGCNYEKYFNHAKYEYNKDGNVTKISDDNNQDGIVDSVRYYGYDSKGRELFKAYDFDADGDIDENRSQNFNEQNKIQEKKILSYRNDKNFFNSMTKYQYDEEGKILNEITLKAYYDDEKEESRIDYHYNQDSQLVEVWYGNQLSTKNHYQDGKLILKEDFIGGELSSKHVYHYENNILKENVYTSYMDKEITFHRQKKYNDKGLLTEEINNHTKIKKYIYDEQTQLILTEDNNEKEEYTYNDDGTLIRKDIYTKNENNKFEKDSYTVYDRENGKHDTIYMDENRIYTRYDNKYLNGFSTSKERRYVYDEHKNLIEIWDDADGKLIEKRVYRFIII
jgi:YD repeat-containing protein